MDWRSTLNRLQQDKGQWAHIARATGLHRNAIAKIVHEDTTRPRIDTVEKIADYYARIDAREPQSARTAT